MKNAALGLLFASLIIAPLPVYAQATTSVVTGTVLDTNGGPVAGASVSLRGPARQDTSTDAKGAFRFASVPTGLYALIVSKAGFDTARTDEVTALAGETENYNVTLNPSSFSSLRTIANVSTRVPGRVRLNSSTASVNVISGQLLTNQGLTQVTKALNETPGIITSPYNPGNGNPSNGASPASEQTPQIRGALAYETESLIDGHPVSVGSAGFYSPNLINPWLLEDVELVKGPGSMPEEINYAINGTMNYRTLVPTAERQGAVMLGYDNWGGLLTGFKATGYTTNRKIGYAVGYVTDGAPGPLKNFSYNATQLPLTSGPPGGPYFMNGQQVALIGSPVGLGIAPPSFNAYDGMAVNFVDPVIGCCFRSDTGYHATSELAKLRFNFTPSTSLTLSYLGGQNKFGNGDPNLYSASPVANTGAPAALFTPCDPANPNSPFNCNPFATGSSTYNCAGGGGSPKCSSAVPFDITSVNGAGYTWTQQNLFQGEFRTALGSNATLLARYYTGSLNNYALLGTASPQLTYNLNTYGTVPLCPLGTAFDPNLPPVAGGTDPNGLQCVGAGGGVTPPVNTTFTGQSVTYSTPNQPNTFTTLDSMNGETLEVQKLIGQNTFTLSYDRSEQASASTADEPSVGILDFSPAKGSKQTFGTLALRGNIVLNPKVQLNVGDYFINYVSHYSIDKGATFNDASHSYNAPRVAVEWRPNVDTAVRFATGASVAPPYISLVSSGGPTWSQIIGGVPAAGYIQNANNGGISAETAWSYDLGVDRRIENSTSVQLDLYLTQLHNLFLTQTSSITPPSFGPLPGNCPNLPCEVSKTENLGVARYQGAELAVTHAPIFGLGWLVQGSLQRAYTYNLPPFFYCAGTFDPVSGNPIPPGPGCVKNTNLAVLPNVNFGGQPTALAGAPNGIGSARVPYSQGYGELNWTGHYGQYYSAGVTYFGSNNAYNVPAFAVVSANARFNINDRGTRLQISGDNLTNAYGNSYAGFFNGIPLPLVNGAMQTNPLTGALQPVPFAATPQGNYGPASFRIMLTQSLGPGPLQP